MGSRCQVAFNAAIGACQFAQRWQEAFWLLSELQRNDLQAARVSGGSRNHGAYQDGLLDVVVSLAVRRMMSPILGLLEPVAKRSLAPSTDERSEAEGATKVFNNSLSVLVMVVRCMCDCSLSLLEIVGCYQHQQKGRVESTDK